MIYLKKLVFRGEELADAILDFSTGLNTITGASDSGKSLVFNLIRFALGGKKIDALPPEAIGYQKVFLEINAAGEICTLLRTIGDDGSVLVFDREIDNINAENASRHKEFSLAPSAKKDKRLSDYLLNLFACPYKYLNINGDNEGFTFSKFARLILLDESRVFASHSIVLDNDSSSDVSAPFAKAAFYAAIRGYADEKLQKLEKPQISKAKLQGQLQQLTELRGEILVEIEAIKNILQGWTFLGVQAEIQDAEYSLKELQKKIDACQMSYSQNSDKIRALNEQKERIVNTMLRMKLLLKNYEADIDRLAFIDEAHALSEQLIELECPVCHQSIPTDEKNSYISYMNALSIERKKLDDQISDLQNAIDDFSVEEKDIDAQIDSIKETQEKLSRSINDTLSTETSDVWASLEKYISLRDQFGNLQKSEQLASLYAEKMADLAIRIKGIHTSKKSSEYPLIIDSSKLTEFCVHVQKYLNAWAFSNARVTFNIAKTDVCIGGKDKAAFGKGARAIINSAFMLGFLDYCIDKGYSHPGFVVIDSPIIAYKEKDIPKDRDYEDSEVPIEVKKAIYDSLTKVQNDRQIVIIDNVEPLEAGIKLHYHHFTGNIMLPRTGFIPNRSE